MPDKKTKAKTKINNNKKNKKNEKQLSARQKINLDDLESF